jgi:rSAM/selenodomain-associated transferase 2
MNPCYEDAFQMSTAPFLSVVIPTLNAERTIRVALAGVAVPEVREVIVVDGGSSDGTPDIARRRGSRVVSAKRGRGSQLAAGAAAAEGDWLLFLHADTRLDAGWIGEVAAFAADPANEARAAAFAFRLDDGAPQARRVERLVRWRVRALALPYGDQGLLISRRLYEEVGGFDATLPIMEDVDIVRRIGRRRLALLTAAASTSAARYRRGGWWLRPARNVYCLALYFLGVSPERIRKIYR